jgi:SAM-dependent methyltransferase
MINWKVRYAALLERYPQLSDPDRRILEVGSGTEGIARYLKRVVVGVDHAFGSTVNQHLTPVRGSILNLPFSEDAFDDVICVDTLEHVAHGERLRAILELIRVARRRVIISGPAGAFAESGDAAYADHIARRRGSVPSWLEEHLRYGIPSLGDLLEMLLTSGHPFTVHVNEGVIQHYSGLFADNYPFMTRFSDLHDAKFPLESPLCAANGDLPYSYLFTIDTTSTRQMTSTEPKPALESERPISATSQPRPAEIFAIGHRVDQMPAIPGIRRILAGAGSQALGLGSEILRDDLGDSIAHRNPDFSEMTAIYWVWKNVTDLGCIGFCHYRRYFDFRKNTRQSTRETHLCNLREVKNYESYFIDQSVIAQTVDDGAIIVARTIEEGIANAEQYMTAHVPEHYLAMVNYILTRHPHLARQVVAQVRDKGFYGNNMFVMRWTDFDRLCRFWFDCLFGLDRQVGNKPIGYQRRMLAFLSERLFDIYVRWLRDSGRRVVEYPLFYLEDSVFSNGA